MQQTQAYAKASAPVNEQSATPYTGSIIVAGSQVHLESENVDSLITLIAIAMSAKHAERKALIHAAAREAMQ